MKGMRELREVLRTVETKATQNFKVVNRGGPRAGCWGLASSGVRFSGSQQKSQRAAPESAMATCRVHTSLPLCANGTR